VKSPMSSIFLVTVQAERLTSLTHLFFFFLETFLLSSFHEFPISKWPPFLCY
jgi:hypothetical protein